MYDEAQTRRVRRTQYDCFWKRSHISPLIVTAASLLSSIQSVSAGVGGGKKGAVDVEKAEKQRIDGG